MKIKELYTETNIKALAIKQPWAWLIVNGYKDIENRTWNTNYRGTFFVHASKGFDQQGYNDVKNGLYGNIPNLPNKEDFEYGGLVGQADIEDCIPPGSDCNSKWYQGEFGFVLTNQKKLPFKQCKGQLSFFKII